MSDKSVNIRGMKLGRAKLLAILVAVAVIIGIFLIARSFKSSKTDQAGPQARVQITANGFVPAVMSVAPGTEVVWTNNDSKPHKVASNPHPTHTETKGLESEELAPGDSYRFRYESNGTFNYHDHLSPTTNGSVIVGE